MASKGSGLSLERFIRGKARPNKGKGESTTGKRKRVEKAVLLRQYRKEKQKIQATGAAKPATSEGGASAGPTSFYDKFFAGIQNDNNDKDEESDEKSANPRLNHKPDPLYKAKRKAQQAKDERNLKRQAIEEKLNEKQKKIEQRKKRHVRLSQRTKTGQPVVKHQIKDILAKLKKSQ